MNIFAEGKLNVSTMYEKEIELKIRELPEDLKREVLDYIEFLLKKYKSKKTKKFKFDWEDGLSEIWEKFTSVELQHKALERRSLLRNQDFDTNIHIDIMPACRAASWRDKDFNSH